LFGPEAFVSPQPGHRLFQRRRGEAADNGAAGFGTRDQGCVRQHVEMLHDRWQRHGERTGQVADGCAFSLAQLGYERAPRRIGERRENVIQFGVLILNHIVNNTTPARPCQASHRGSARALTDGVASASGARPFQAHANLLRARMTFKLKHMPSSTPCIALLLALPAGYPHLSRDFARTPGASFRNDV